MSASTLHCIVAELHLLSKLGVCGAKQAGAVVLGVSGDDADSHAAFKSKLGLPYTLLADDGNKVRYGNLCRVRSRSRASWGCPTHCLLTMATRCATAAYVGLGHVQEQVGGCPTRCLLTTATRCATATYSGLGHVQEQAEAALHAAC